MLVRCGSLFIALYPGSTTVQQYCASTLNDECGACMCFNCITTLEMLSSLNFGLVHAGLTYVFVDTSTVHACSKCLHVHVWALPLTEVLQHSRNWWWNRWCLPPIWNCHMNLLWNLCYYARYPMFTFVYTGWSSERTRKNAGEVTKSSTQIQSALYCVHKYPHICNVVS